jgi:hypothetical protein
MSSLPNELLLALGLAPADVEPLASAAPPSDQTGYGLAPGAAAAVGIDEIAHSAWFSPANLELAAPELESVRYWDLDPRVVALEASHEAVLKSEGDVLLDEGRVVLDGRARGCAVRLATAAGELVVTNVAGRILVLRVLSSSMTRERAELAPREDEPVSAVPSPEHLLDGLGCAAWLLEATKALALSSRLADRVAALGLLGRAWSPPDAAARAAFARGDLVVPIVRVRAWAETLAEPTLDSLTTIALRDAEDWQRALESELLSLVADPEAGAPLAVLLLHRRDNLESIAWVLDSVGRGDRLRLQLDELDARSRTHASALRAAGEVLAADERLASLAWQAPEFWWGQLA